MVADPPEGHLRGDTLVDAVEQLLDEPGAGLGGNELKRTAPLELPLGSPEPTPRTLPITEDFFGQRSNPSDPDRPV